MVAFLFTCQHDNNYITSKELNLMLSKLSAKKCAILISDIFLKGLVHKIIVNDPFVFKADTKYMKRAFEDIEIMKFYGINNFKIDLKKYDQEETIEPFIDFVRESLLSHPEVVGSFLKNFETFDFTSLSVFLLQ